MALQIACDYLKKEDYFNRGNEHVGQIRKMYNLGTDGGRWEKVVFDLQILIGLGDAVFHLGCVDNAQRNLTGQVVAVLFGKAAE